MDERLASYLDDRRDEHRDALFELLRQPSVSARGEGLDACADLLIDIIGRYGFDARAIPTSTAPIVYLSETVDESLPTVLFYGHYDVQPADDDTAWDSPPFDPEVRDASIYARGAGDNKGQLLTHVFALDAVKSVFGALPVNVRFVFEGGEENDSVGFREFIDEHADLIDADLVYVADGPMHESGRPTVLYGNRGLVSADISMTGANTDLHSGNFGGPVPNPATELVTLLADLVGDGDIALPGFYDDVAITDADRAAVADIPGDPAAIRESLDLDAFTVDDADYYERLLLEPTLSINGLTAGDTGPGLKTIIPAEAQAKLDIRLVPDQDPEDVYAALETFVAERAPEADVDHIGTFPPMKTPLTTEYAAPVRAALEDAWGEPPVDVPLLGGSLPVAYFRRATDVPILIVPYANPDQNNHSPNEHLDVECFENGIRTTAAFLGRLGSL